VVRDDLIHEVQEMTLVTRPMGEDPGEVEANQLHELLVTGREMRREGGREERTESESQQRARS
jgi:hypothetical protein